MSCMELGGSYHRRVLRPLFFGTLNTPVSARAPTARAFGAVPFLNGGLFAPAPLERRWPKLSFSDASLGRAFDELFARYRFTAREDSDAWSEAAIDPEMLGKAFESLMSSPERRSSGAFYTPQALVAGVTRSALTSALAHAPLSRDVVEAMLDGAPVPESFASLVRERLGDIRVLDPACGSGAFLVHTLETLASLRARAGDERPAAELRRELLTKSIFGVDVNATAVWLCELRLWLSVVIESEETNGMRVPPLPNLDRHIRVGDSLSGDAFEEARGAGGSAIARMRQRYARATGARKRTLERTLERHERTFALAHVGEQMLRCAARRRDLLAAMRGRDLFGERVRPSAGDRACLARERTRARELAARRRALRSGGALPFAWATHFPDVAQRGGFDLVIGNPPWVRLHRIPADARAALRARFAVFGGAAWERGARSANAGAGFAAQIDLAALFLERSLALTRERGTLALLLPAKIWRSLAGGGARRLLRTRAQVLALDDWSESPAAFDAAVYPSLVVARSGAGEQPPAVLSTLHRKRDVLRWCIAPAALSLDGDPASPWVAIPPPVRAAFDRLSRAGTPIGESPLGAPLLGVKCGCNEAFIVTRDGGDRELAYVRSGEREAAIERGMLRPLLRGEHATPWRAARSEESIIWTHDARGAVLAELPPNAATWMTRWRRRLAVRSDARATTAWWILFRTAAASSARARVVWADMARTPRALVLEPGDPTVPLNSCYVVACELEADAHALAALLNSALAAAWLHVLAEPARGGYHRYLGMDDGAPPAAARLAPRAGAPRAARRARDGRRGAGPVRAARCRHTRLPTSRGRCRPAHRVGGAMILERASMVRARIAARVLEAVVTARTLGAISLHAHQCAAVDRLRELLRDERGALLADDAGLGKTYVAAAIMREAARPLLVIPASLRVMWGEALRAASVCATIVTYSALSRGAAPEGEFDLLVLDEAHHARTPSTRRYALLAVLAARARVLLLTATPVHNRREELSALFALFLGARAHASSDAALARLIVRRERAEVADVVAIPEAPAPEWIRVRDDASLLDDLLSLPPPVPPASAGDGGVLLTWGLLRQWASSRAALAGALRRRIVHGVALESALEEGRHPTRRELRAWSSVDGAVQLAFPQLMATPAASTHELLPRVRAHLTAVRALLARVRADAATDASRGDALRAILARHAGEKVLAFSQFTDTIHALFAALRDMPRIAALTAHGARTAGGRLSRQETLERFAPRAMGVAAPREIERIDLLLTTDLASEGLNLHDASVVVHLDLPWTPARLEQRVARSRRMGALHARTMSYAFAPPADAERVLDVERRLRAKVRTMEAVIGSTGALLPNSTNEGTHGTSSRAVAARLPERVRGVIEAWRNAELDTSDDDASAPCIACVAAPRRAVLALAMDGGRAELAAAIDGDELSTDSAIVLAAIELSRRRGRGARFRVARRSGGGCAAMGGAHRRRAGRRRTRVARRIAPNGAPAHRGARHARAAPPARAHRSARGGRAARRDGTLCAGRRAGARRAGDGAAAGRGVAAGARELRCDARGRSAGGLACGEARVGDRGRVSAIRHAQWCSIASSAAHGSPSAKRAVARARSLSLVSTSAPSTGSSPSTYTTIDCTAVAPSARSKNAGFGDTSGIAPSSPSSARVVSFPERSTTIAWRARCAGDIAASRDCSESMRCCSIAVALAMIDSRFASAPLLCAERSAASCCASACFNASSSCSAAAGLDFFSSRYVACMSASRLGRPRRNS